MLKMSISRDLTEYVLVLYAEGGGDCAAAHLGR